MNGLEINVVIEVDRAFAVCHFLFVWAGVIRRIHQDCFGTVYACVCVCREVNATIAVYLEMTGKGRTSIIINRSNDLFAY